MLRGLALGGTALVGVALPGAAQAQAQRTVVSEADLRDAINAANADTTNQTFTIRLAAPIAVTGPLPTLNRSVPGTATLDLGGFSLNGNLSPLVTGGGRTSILNRTGTIVSSTGTAIGTSGTAFSFDIVNGGEIGGGATPAINVNAANALVSNMAGGLIRSTVGPAVRLGGDRAVNSSLSVVNAGTIRSADGAGIAFDTGPGINGKGVSGQATLLAGSTTGTINFSAGGTVSLDGADANAAAAIVGAIDFTTGAITGGSGTLNLRSGNGAIDLSTVSDMTVLNKLGDGTWTLTGASASPAATITAGGAVPVAGASTAGTLIFDTTGLTGAINLNGGTIRAIRAGAFGTGQINSFDPRIEYGATGTYENAIFLASRDPSGDPTVLAADTGVAATLTGRFFQETRNEDGSASAAQPLVIDGAGAITLTNTANLWNGTTTINAGATLIGTGATISGSVIRNSGALVYDQAAGTASTAAQPIVGTGSLTKRGGGTTTLSGQNQYSGPTTIAAGTLTLLSRGFSPRQGNSFPDNINSLALSSATALTGGDAVLAFSNANGLNRGTGYVNNLSGVAGSRITLGGQFDYGELFVTNTGSTVFDGTITADRVSALYLTVAGASQSDSLTLTAANTELNFANAATATLKIVGAGALTNALVRTYEYRGGGSGTFDITGIDAAETTIRSLGDNGTVLLGTKTLRLAAAESRFDGVIVGSGGLAIDGGREILGGINAYTGATTIAAGATLVLGRRFVGFDETTGEITYADGSIAASSGVQADGTFDLREGGDTITINRLTGAASGQVLLGTAGRDRNEQSRQAFAINAAAVAPVQALVIRDAAGTFAGVISDLNTRYDPETDSDVTFSTGSGVTIAGGTQVFTGNNSYTGTTTLDGGNLMLGDGGATGSVAGPIALSGNNGAGTLTFNRSDAGLVIVGAISGTGNLVQAGSGATTLSALNSYTGTTTIADGTLVVADGRGEGIGQSSAVALTGANAVLQFNSADQGLVRNLSGVAGSRITFAPDADGNAFYNVLNVANSVDTVFGGTVTGAEAQEERPFGVQISKFGAGALTLTAANANVDFAFVADGALRLAGDASLTNAFVFLAGSETGLSFDISGVAAPDTSIANLGGGSFVLLGAKTLRISNAQSGYDGVISGSGGLTIEGGPRLSLGGINTYTGATTIAAGATLGLASTITGRDPVTRERIFADGSIAASSGVQADGIFDARFLSRDTTIRALTGAATGQVLLGSQRFDEATQDFAVAPRTLTITDANGAFAGVISDTIFLINNATGVGSNVSTGSGVTIAGGTQVFTGDNTYTGATTLAGGNLSLGDGGTTGSVAGPIALTSGTLTINRSNAVRIDQVLSGAGNLVQAGTGTTTLTAANSYTGATSVDAGTLALAGNGSLASEVIVATGAAFDISGVTSGATTARGLSGGGTTALGANTLTLTAANDGYAGVVSGTGGLTVAGGRQVLTGTNTYTGATTAADGATLALGDGGTGGSVAGAIVANGTVDLNRSDSYTLGNVISGAGAVNKLGAGTTTLTGGNGTGAQFTGTLNVDAGTLSVGGTFGDTAGNAATVNVNAGGTLGGTGTIAGAVFVNEGGTAGAGNSPGTLTVLGNYTLNAGANSLFELGTPDMVGGPTNDLIVVGGDLTLGGTLTLVNSADASMALVSGDYRLFNYGGTLSGSFASIVAAANAPDDATVTTAVPGQVNLSIRAAGQSVQYWDGTDLTGAARGPQGGSGTWNAVATNWTGEDTTVNRPWRSGVGIFGTTGGTVTVESAQAFQGLQFTVSGYRLNGPGSLTMTGDPGTTADQSFVNVDAGVAATIAAALTGDGVGLVKLGGGNLVLAGANAYTGTTTVAAGTLTGTTASIVGSDIVVDGVLAYDQAFSGTVAQSIAGAGRVTVGGAQGATVTFAGDNAFTGAADTPAAFTSAGPALVFTGTNTSVAGTVALTGTGARLEIAEGASLRSSAGIAVTGTATTGTTTIVNRAGGTIAAGFRAVDVANVAAVTNAGTIAGGSSTGVLLRGGGSVDNQASGVVTAGSGGVIFAGNPGTVTNAGRIAGANWGVLQNTGGAALTVTNVAGGTISGTRTAGIYTGNGVARIDNAGTLTGGNAGVFADGALTLTNGGLIRNTAGAADAPARSGVYSSAADARITNAGTIDSQVAGGHAIRLDGGAGTIVNLAGGTLAGNGGAAVLLTGAGYAIDLRGGSTVTGGIDARATTGANALTLAGTMTGGYRGGSGVDTVTLVDSAAFTGGLDGGAGVDAVTLTGTGTGALNVGDLANFETVTKTGTGRFDLTGTDASTANFSVQQGILSVSGGAAINDGATVDIASAGTLNLTSAETIGALSGTGAVTLGINTLSVAGPQSSVFAGALSGSGGLVRAGTGRLTLAGANSYTGATTVTGGTLALGASNVLADATRVTVATGGTLDLGANNDTVADLTLAGALNGSGTLTAGRYLLVGGTAHANLGAGTLTQVAGTTTLNGTSAASRVDVAGGTLVLGASDRLADAATVSVASGATLALGANRDTVGVFAAGGTLSGTGTLSAAQYQLTGATVNANLGAGTLSQLGGTSVLGGTAAATTVSIDAGTLRLAARERLADAAAVSLAQGAVLDLAGFEETVGSVSGAGALALGAGTLTVGGTGADFAFTGTTSGTGGITKTGAGTFTLGGAQALTGPLTVGQGTLALAGSTAGSARVQGGTLTGTGSFAGNLALASGTLAPGTAAQPVGALQAGSLTVTGGTVAVDFGGASNGFAADALRVAGAATLSGGTVSPRAIDPTNGYRVAQTYTVVQAGSVAGQFANGAAFAAVGGNADLQFRLRYDLLPNAVVLEVRRQIDFGAGLGAGASANQRSVAAALSGGAFTASDGFVATLNSLAALDAAGRRTAFDSIGGEALAGVSTATALAGNRFTDIVRARLSRGDAASGGGVNVGGLFDPGARSAALRVASETVGGLGLVGEGRGIAAWAQGYGADGRITGRDAARTLDNDTAGLALGLEGRFGNLTLGIAGALTDIEANVRGLQSRNSGTLYQGGGYLAFDNGTTFANASGSYFGGTIDTRRTVQVGGTFVGQARGRADTDGFTAGAALGQRFGGEEGVRFVPQLSGQVVRVTRDAFTESGAGNLSLAAGRERRTLYTATAEGRLSNRFATGSGIVEPYLTGGVQVNFGDRDSLAGLRLTGAPAATGAFTIEGAGLAKVAGILGGGIDAHPTENVTLGAGVETTLSERQKEGRVTMRLRVAF